MKRMVKNGDLIDVEPDGSITVAGKPIAGGGGGDYTAGSNIEISASKEISVKKDLTAIDSLQFSVVDSPIIGSYGAGVKIKNVNLYIDFPDIYLYPYDSNKNPDRYFFFSVIADHRNTNYGVIIDHRGLTGAAYAFLTKGSSVPFVPSQDGTYVLKATVSNNKITYEWVAG